MGGKLHQHVFSAIEGTNGLMYGRLHFYEHPCDAGNAAREATNFLCQVLTALAKSSRYA